ncbi:VOC family protein [Arthrobacter sp. H35-D1]|uniref:VOC family protein n=1 Tax=Arthrobacter sp. H35-D1 TaxID=3046202 RepID=UPI0024B9EAE4|nr:VOC family protein [Arthrobacter sp. H35-D1]MDJ0314984.1 hypothetical protein [Arthrobacter sp. H35-D1]
MKIRNVTLTVHDLAAAVTFYRNVLDMCVEENADNAVVQAGSSRLSLIQGEPFDGVHHVAFGILPADFELAHAWLSARVPLLVNDGAAVIVGSGGWNSRSLYFLGPEDIILELIARNADADADPDPDAKPGNRESPRILSISEIGIAVPDVQAAVERLSGELGIPPFYDQDENFAPLGNHDGLLIVVHQDRIWFPTTSLRPARGPLAVEIDSSTTNTQLNVSPTISITTAGSTR